MMSEVTSPNDPLMPSSRGPILESDLGRLRDSWLTFFLLGIALTVLGFFAMGYAIFFSLTTAIFFGVVAVIGGVIQIISAFSTRTWGSFLLDLLIGIIYLIAGGFMIRHPVITVQVLTIVLGVLFLTGGILRISGSISIRFRHWGWVLFSGILELILGIVILSGLPWNLWLIGLFLGIDLVLSGVSWMALGLTARSLPATTGER